MIGKMVREFLPKTDLLAYLEAIMRVYNLDGRRDNKYKARIKILVHEIGAEESRAASSRNSRRLTVQASMPTARRSSGSRPISPLRAMSNCRIAPRSSMPAIAAHAEFARFVGTNVTAHRRQGYAAVTISLKPIAGVPGDATSEQMRIVADLAERYSFGEIRVTHIQNLVLPHVRKDDLFALWEALDAAELGTANSGLVTDIIACPGLDYCSLATARSIPIAQAISRRFADEGRERVIGPLGITISGCINACGHHHIGNIGILGLEKNGTEYYQLTLGGDATEHAALGERLGPGLAAEEVPDAVEKIVGVYLASRTSGEEFIETYRRVGIAPFREAFQGELHAAD